MKFTSCDNSKLAVCGGSTEGATAGGFYMRAIDVNASLGSYTWSLA